MTENRSSIAYSPITILRAGLRPRYVILLALVAFQIYLITSSEGFHRIDEGAHFIDNVRVLEEPSLSVGIWQRFGRVWLFALPAQLGHKAVKIFASLLFLATIFVCYKVADLERIPGKEWIIAFVGFQPVFLDISYTCFAEMPAAFLLVLSYYLYRSSWWKTSLFVASLVFLFRFEMLIFAAIVFVAAVRNRKFSALPFVLIGPVIWYLFSWLLRGDPVSLFSEFLTFSKYPKYTQGTSWGHYLTHATEIFGVVQIALLIALLVSDIFRKKISNPVLYGTIALCFVINTLASSKDVNWTGSVGDLRYLTPVAPFVGILALAGLAVVTNFLSKIPYSKYAPHILSAVIVFGAVSDVKPHHLSPYEKGIMALARSAATDSTNTPILTNHWAAKFALLGNRRLAERITWLFADTLKKYPRAYIIWDPQIAYSPFSQQRLTLADVRDDSTIVLMDSVLVDQRTQFLFLKDSHHVEVNPHR